MSQIFTRHNSSPQTFSAKNVDVSVVQTGNTTLLDMVVEDSEKLSVQVDNTIQALDAFIIQGRVHRDATDEIIASVAGDFSAPTGRMLRATGAPVTLAAGASASFDVDVSRLYSVKILASGSNAAASVVSIYASGGPAAGTPPANINASFDGQIGAVELKNAADDTRALIGAGTAITEANNAVAVKDASIGLTTGAAVITDAVGTVQQYLRGLVKRWVDALGGGTEAAALRVTVANDSTGLLSVDDNGASLTVDNPILSVVGGGLEATAQRVTIASDSTGVVSVDDNGGNLSVDWAGTVPPIGAGTEAAALRVTVATDSTGVLSVDDNGASLTVDNAALSVVGGGVEAAALRVTLASDSTGVISVDDNGGSLTVDGAVTADTELTTADLDTGVGTDTRAVVGLVLAASGGGVLVGSANPVPVSDNAGSLTVDNAILSVVGGGTEAAAQRVTIASDSTGVISVDDNGGALTVDWAGTAPPIGAGLEATALRVTVATDSTGVLSVDDNSGSLTIDNSTLAVVGGGTEAAAMRVTLASDSTGLVSVDDNGASLTVDNSTLAVVGGGTEATAMRVTIASDSTGVVSVDDNGGSLTVDGAVSITGAVDTELTTADLDTGVGTDTRAVVGMVLAASGGGALVGSANPMPVSDNGGNLSVDWAGTVPPIGAGTEAAALRVTVATDSTGVVSVDDNGASLTVDNPILSVVGGGLEATAQRVTIASDSTGVLSVDDNGGNISVDWAGTVPPIGAGTEAAALRVTLATDSTGLVSVDDNGGSLTVDGTVSITGAVDTELTTADLDTGAGTDTRAVVGLVLAASGGGVLVGSANPVPVSDNAGSLTIDNATLSTTGGGVEAGALRVTLATDSTGVVSVDDNGASLTIDNAQLSVVGSGTEAAAMRVTIATDSTGVVSVDDNGGSLTVDGTVSVSGAVDTELTTADLDTGAGTDTRAVVGIVLAASGGGALVGSANPMPVSDNAGSLTIDNAQLSVVGSGTEAAAMRVTIASDSTGVVSVDDNGASLTVDNAQLSVVGSGTEATALRVTLATDSTGVVSVDDNGGSLTVDGTFWQATQPVSIATAPVLVAGTAIIGKVGVDQTTPGTTNGVEPANGSAAQTTAFAASLVVKAAAGSLYGFSGYNSGPAQFIQVHNAASLPADTAVPIVVFKAPAADNFSWDSGGAAYPFSTGIVLSNSSTGPTKTIGAADCWFNALYR